jgi:hypothetical protein
VDRPIVMLPALIYLLAIYSPTGAQVHQPQPRCKATPESPDWPAESEWKALNETVDGRLLKPTAPAAACHPAHELYNAEKCKSIQDSWTSSQWHSDNPTSSLWQNWNNYSCLPDSKNPCTTEGFPVYVVNVTKSEHVKAAVDFARTRNVRVNIKSTGHDFLGRYVISRKGYKACSVLCLFEIRSVQPKSLSIWTHHLRSLEYYEASYSPRGCNISIPGAAVSAGSGTQMREVQLHQLS